MDYSLIYDVVLIHPPAIYDFRKKPVFAGSLATVDRIQYNKVSIGILSIADYLDRHGYKVIVDNLADRMVSNKVFNAEEHIEKVSARIYAIGLHWQQHSQGAIEVARLCKSLHPDSLVIMGGLTATYFHEEIIQKYEFVDAVIRGEGEKPMLELVKAYQKHGQLTGTPNLTYRLDSDDIVVTPLMKPSENLDEFDFTRLDLLEPKTSVFAPGVQPRWSLVVCRGCMYNCTICGGSAHYYKTYFGMEKPSFRSPGKIVEDIRKLSKQGIRFISLYQDPRMGGNKYWQGLIEALHKANLDIDGLNIDIFAPVDEEFAREIATIGKPVVLYICPDAGSCDVRKIQGRPYSNDDLLNTVKVCYRYHIPIVVFFSIGLSGETGKTIKETWKLWDELCSLNQAAINKGGFGNIGSYVLRQGPIIGPVMLDPGSLAFDFPDKYGYKLIFNNLEEYIEGMSMPSWHQWINYETNMLNKDRFVELIFESIEHYIHQKEEWGAYNKGQAAADYFLLKADRIAVDEVNRIMNLSDEEERESRLKALAETINTLFSSSPNADDPYGYREMLGKRLFYQLASH